MAKEKRGVGRPRTYDREKEAVLLEEWSKKETSIHIAEFVLERGYGDPGIISDWAKETKEFGDALKRTKLRIALRLRKRVHDKENPYNYGIFMREIGMYDMFLKHFETDEKTFQAYLKNMESQPIEKFVFEDRGSMDVKH